MINPNAPFPYHMRTLNHSCTSLRVLPLYWVPLSVPSDADRLMISQPSSKSSIQECESRPFITCCSSHTDTSVTGPCPSRSHRVTCPGPQDVGCHLPMTRLHIAQLRSFPLLHIFLFLLPSHISIMTYSDFNMSGPTIYKLGCPTNWPYPTSHSCLMT